MAGGFSRTTTEAVPAEEVSPVPVPVPVPAFAAFGAVPGGTATPGMTRTAPGCAAASVFAGSAGF